MNIWLITTGEPIPNQNIRSHRTGMLSKVLEQAGHKVLWWTTTFDHQLKRYLYVDDTKESLSENIELFYLHSSVQYKKNISIKRLINHLSIAKKFKALAYEQQTPDIIFCSFPTIDLSFEAVRYGKKNKVPVIIDVRDLWPDIFIDPFSQWMHPIIKIPLINYIFKTQYILKECTSITAISEDYLKWALEYGNRNCFLSDNVFPLGYEKENYSDQEILLNFEMFQHKNIQTSKTTVWFVGTFGHTYDLSVVIQGARKLQESNNNDIQFIFTGDGEKMQQWSEQAAGLKNIIFTGWVDKAELKYLADIADIGLMAYRKGAPQGLPNKIFEYLSNGIPILSSLQSEAKHLITNNQIGLTYEAEDRDSFLKNLIQMTENKLLLKQMRENAIRLFDTRYSSAIIYPRLIKFIENQWINHETEK